MMAAWTANETPFLLSATAAVAESNTAKTVQENALVGMNIPIPEYGRKVATD
jgi:hypothetical protein